MAQEVRWRHGRRQLAWDSTVEILRFEVADLVAIIKNCVAASELYDELVTLGGLPAGSQVVPVSCFAVAGEWTPQALAEGTRYTSYRLVDAADLLDAGFLIWPTDVFNDGEADHRNEVHFDVIVAWKNVAREEFASQDKKMQARERLRPASSYSSACWESRSRCEAHDAPDIGHRPTYHETRREGTPMDAALAPVGVVDVELGPLERKLGVAYVSDVHFDDPVTLRAGNHVSLRDVDGTVYDGVVSAVEDGKFCNRYRVTFTP